jgi:uncharacterized protein (TIGR03663 family)
MTEHSAPKTNILSRIDLETALYGLLFILAALLRLADLDARPLNLAEAGRALDALRLAQGQAASSAGSPLLLHGTAVSFFLFSANDFTARLFPALFGAAIVLLPFFWRRRLGHLGALIASILLAFSPLTLFASRSAGPEVFVIGSAMAFLTGIMGFADSGNPRHLYLSAAGLALLLASGPGAYFALLVFVVAGVVAYLLSRRQGFAGEIAARLRESAPALRMSGLIFAGTALAAGTLFGFNLQGLRGFGDTLTGWWQGFGGGAGLPWFSPALWVAFYEPLAVVFGVIGGVRAIHDRDFWGSLLLGWAAGSLAMLMAWPVRASGDFLLVSVPLVLLAGKSLAALLEDVRAKWQGVQDGVFLAVFAVLSVYVYLQLAGFADVVDPTRARAFATLAWVGAGLLIVLSVADGLIVGVAGALRNAELGVAVVALMVTFSGAMSVAYNASGRSAELLDPAPTSPAVRQLVADAGTISLRRLGDERELPVTVMAAEPDALAWYLRGFRHLDVRGDAGGAATADIVIAPEGIQPKLEGGYSGQGYDALLDYRLKPMSARDWWRWALWRIRPTTALERVVLWVKAVSSE